jgi:tetratricopeptide (TPR) repeat protein
MRASGSIRRAVAKVVALAALAAPAVAEARWLRVETDKFVVFGKGSERSVRDYAAKLTTFDQVLRLYNPTVADRKPATKVQVFMLGGVGDLKRVRPDLPQHVLGFYSAMNEGVFAFAVNAEGFGKDDVLFHEYAHHFMLENYPLAYPGWFVEGWAEYFMTTEIKGASVKVGGYNPARAFSVLERSWLPLQDVLSKTTAETNPERRDVYYAQAWLLMHYFLSDTGRARQLEAAARAITQGAAPAAALEKATGKTLGDLTRELRGYRKLQMMSFTFKELPDATMSVSQLPPSADELLLDNQRLILSATGDVDAELLQSVRKKAAKYPGDWFAERTLARAEFVMGDVGAGEAIMKRRLAAAPEDREDLLLAGLGQIMAGMRDDNQREARFRAARAALGKAYQLDKSDFRPLYAYGLSRTVEDAYPTDNDLNVLLEARGLAPSVQENSVRAGVALIQKGRKEEAARILAAVINNPHGGASTAQLRRLLDGEPDERDEVRPAGGEGAKAAAPGGQAGPR